MRVTEKKLAANRKNAQKSTGPKTPEGKQASRLNALKHGAYANDFITFCADTKDDPREYERMLATFTNQMQPVGPVEKTLVWKFTYYVWRYRKAMDTLSTLYQMQRLRGYEPAQIKWDNEI